MLNFKKIFLKLLIFVVGVSTSFSISLSTFSGYSDSNIGLSSYLNKITNDNENIVLKYHVDNLSAFRLPGVDYKLSKNNTGVFKSFVLADMNKETKNNFVFKIDGFERELNVISYINSGPYRGIEQNLDLNLIKGEVVDDFTLTKGFYISQQTADYFIENDPALTVYDDLINKKIVFQSTSFSILGIFQRDTTIAYNALFHSINSRKGYELSDDFLVCPYYLMNNGFLAKNNSFVLYLNGNSSVYYHYLNFIDNNWKGVNAIREIYSYKNNSYNYLNLSNELKLYYSSNQKIITISIGVSLTFCLLFLAFILCKIKGKRMSFKRSNSLLYLFGIFCGTILLKLINAFILNDVFVVLTNYYFVFIMIILFSVISTILFSNQNFKTEKSNLFYESDL